VREHRPDRRDLRAGMREWPTVGHVGGDDPAVAQRPARGGGELRRGQVSGRASACENVDDDHVE
jgi:hypothetical protein